MSVSKSGNRIKWNGVMPHKNLPLELFAQYNQQ
uniref:Uncharacterized protein n=1 Tax=Arundo donax TaxID=35708 RepID=A0A0A9H4F2_ARUDO